MKIKLFFLLLFCSLSSFAQQFVQTFDANEVAPVTTGSWTYTGTAISIANNIISDGVIPNSGTSSANNHLLFSNCGTSISSHSVLISGINLSSRTDIKVGFNLRKTAAYSITTNFEFSTDGGLNWTLISNLGTLGSTIWSFQSFNLPNSANNSSDLRFRISFDNIVRSCNGAPNLRIDDFIVFYGSNSFPVNLLSFTGQNSQGQNRLNWATDAESNFSHFEVMRSFDAKGYETIGRVDGKGTTSNIAEYVFNDDYPRAGNNYYKLKQVDLDGTSEYSKAIAVFNDAKLEVVVYPNPSNEEIYIKNLNLEEIASIEIKNKAGQLLKKLGNQDLTLNISDIHEVQLIIDIKLKNGFSIIKNIIKL